MRRLWAVIAVVTVVGCKCERIQQIKPTLGFSPPAVQFGPVKNGDTAVRSVRLEAQTSADVVISKIELTEGNSVGGPEAFTVSTTPITVMNGSPTNLSIQFKPTVLQEYGANLVLTTNDEERPTVRIPLIGEGAKPILKVTPDCAASRMCMGTAVVSPPSLDFGAEPLMRQMMIDASRLPAVAITNEGQVALVISRLEITGTDAAAFRIEGNVMTPLEYEASAGVNVPIRFRPLSAAQLNYSATLIIESDDPDAPSVSVALTGRLAPNAPPTVCANLVNVAPVDDLPRDYASRWPEVLTVPMGGYDFSRTRDVEPRAMVRFSALSDNNPTSCTTDPEDGRTGLTFQWAITQTPPGSPPLGMSTSPTFNFTPIVTGDYAMTLTVADMQGNQTVVPIKFVVAIKQDLAVQLQWTGFADTDLDLHLVRPSSTTPGDPFSGAFSYFNEGAFSRTSGDVNGYSWRAKMTMPAFDFDWGFSGATDDPKLNIDDLGTGNLLEAASLNYPERDTLCDGGRCAYKVFVHYFRDARMGAMTSCFADGGTGCTDGEQCSCAMDLRCVATPPQDGGRPLGAGECRAAPKPVVKVFLKGAPTPAATIPLAPAEILLGAPCAMLYVADVNWPAVQEIGSLPDGGTPPATITDRTDAGIAWFGKRQPGDLTRCAPDVTLTNWYSRQP